MEQHTARLGMDSGRLEAARVSASRNSPMGEALDSAARYVDTASLGETNLNVEPCRFRTDCPVAHNR